MIFKKKSKDVNFKNFLFLLYSYSVPFTELRVYSTITRKHSSTINCRWKIFGRTKCSMSSGVTVVGLIAPTLNKKILIFILNLKIIIFFFKPFYEKN